MKRIVVALGLLLLPAAALAEDMTPQEQISVLSIRINTLELDLMHAYLALTREQAKSAALAKEVADMKKPTQGGTPVK